MKAGTIIAIAIAILTAIVVGAYMVQRNKPNDKK